MLTISSKSFINYSTMAQIQVATPPGALAQIQVSVPDFVATFTAGYSLSGYLGGFDSYRTILGYMRSTFFEERLQELQLDRNIRLRDTDVHVLTGSGPMSLQVPNSKASFGGDLRTQFIGLTLCALAHEIYDHGAVDLFWTFLAPHFFGGENVFMDALNLQLHDDSVLKRILNEGASRGLTTLFNDQAASSPLPSIGFRWSSQGDSFAEITELRMVGGLLRWIVDGSKGIYRTRSGLVARVALYLKAVGYSIGNIQSWDGIDPPPPGPGPRAVILVTGGSSQTDPLMAGPEEFAPDAQNHPLVFHYTWRTVGATLFQSLAYPSTSSLEVLQTRFEDIYRHIEELVHVTYQLSNSGTTEDVTACFRWQQTDPSNGNARAIAGIYFPLSAHHVASFYRDIATDDLVSCVRDRSRRSVCLVANELEPNIVQYRATTAIIILALTSRLSPSDFETARHCTRMDLRDESWIRGMCSVLDRGVMGQMPLSHAAWLLGATHANVPVDSEGIADNKNQGSDNIIGYQSGIYTVLLRLLVNMKPSSEAVGLTCKDVFFANLEACRDGTIRTSSSDTVFPEVNDRHNPQENALIRAGDIWSGAPVGGEPDTALYLNFERSVRSRGEPLLCLAGRIQGMPTATVSIIDVLKVILLSLDEPASCNHTVYPDVINVPTSRWNSKRQYKPIGTLSKPTFISTAGDDAWTLFVAGQAAIFNPRIVFRCIRCAKDKAAERQRTHTLRANSEEIGNFSVLIGYSPVEP